MSFNPFEEVLKTIESIINISKKIKEEKYNIDEVNVIIIKDNKIEFEYPLNYFKGESFDGEEGISDYVGNMIYTLLPDLPKTIKLVFPSGNEIDVLEELKTS